MMYRNFVKELVLVLLIIQNNCFALPQKTSSSDNSNKSASQTQSSDSNDATTENYYPFVLSQGEITPAEVAGLRITNGKIVLLSFEDTYSIKDLTQNGDFSDMNFFKQYPKLISVELNGLTLTKDMLENLQKFLPSGLKSLSVLSCNIEKEDYELLSDIFEKHNSLESIGIISPDLLGGESTRILEAISKAKVKFLNIALGELAKDGSKYLAGLIANSGTVLESLSLGWGKVTDGKKAYQKIFDAINKTTTLNKFEFSAMSISEDNSKIVFNSIRNLTHLNTLKIFFGNLSKHNHIKLFENVEALGDSLKKLRNLETLDISFMELPSDILQLISQSIESKKTLKTLNISGNKLDEKVAESLSEALKDMNVTTLIANDCNIDAKVFSSLCKSTISSIKHLYLRGNQIKDGAKSLPIANMPDLLVIDFSQNKMNYDDAMAFIELTKDHPTLHIVNFKNNSGIEAMSSIEKTIKNDQLVEWKLKNYSDHQVSFFGL